MSEKKRSISALKNGTVIDHIKNENTFKILQILNLKDEHLMIGTNLKSKKLGKKGIIKVADKELSKEELNKVSFVAPKATIALIKDYDVKKKFEIDFPKEFVGVAKCGNYNCITNNEPVETHFFTLSQDPIIVKCKYCEKVFSNELEII
ncbi:aspartate carbamoyltransferase regulatory subunit [Candidatus Woesearchaeota archaeon]|nr:aspartate carbamoyltransferase regulatory subunit [Candidatus Woesearchaeota archaeon]